VSVRSPASSAPHVILFVGANPMGSGGLRLDEECAAIERELSMTEGRDDYLFLSKWANTTDDLMRHLNQLRPSVIHFSGHGSGSDSQHRGSDLRDLHDGCVPPDDGLYVQDAHGRPQCLHARGLRRMVEAAAASVRVVVLNACYSSAHADELRHVVDCVVGMKGAISATTARSFAVAFYRALGNRRSVGNAVEQARAVFAAGQLPEEQLPCCTTRGGLDAAQIFLSESGTPAPGRASCHAHARRLATRGRCRR
jgi:hypothetical protein